MREDGWIGGGPRVVRLLPAVPPPRDRSIVSDEAHMGTALELAERGLGLASVKPRVGAAVGLDGRVIGRGWHEGPGAPHAEVVALREVGSNARGATLYTTL